MPKIYEEERMAKRILNAGTKYPVKPGSFLSLKPSNDTRFKWAIRWRYYLIADAARASRVRISTVLRGLSHMS
jgi:hypothetical protein